jgi:DNA polymerase III delta prime subunit
MYDFFDAGFSFTKKSSFVMKPLMKCMKTIDKRIRLAKKDPNSMTVSYANEKIMKGWILEARKRLLQYRIPQDLSIEKLPELWAETIQNQFEIHSTNIPYNVLLIPTFYEELVMAMDKLIMGEHNSWKEIYNALKPMMLFIHQWAINLEQFGD